MTSTTAGRPWSGALRRHWKTLAAREQALVLLAAGLLGLALAWWLLLAPALATLRGSSLRHEELDARLARMQALQAEAQQLRAAPRPRDPVDAPAALRAGIAQHLPQSAQLAIAGDRATLRLQAAPAEALAQWLAQVRASAHAIPVQAQLRRNPADSGRWDGTLVLALPSAP